MAYAGASTAAESRTLLGDALEALQKDPNIPEDVLSVASNVARAVGALFDAERAESDRDGKPHIKDAMGFLSQTMALLQDVRSEHAGIEVATRALAGVMQLLYPLAQAPTMRPPSMSPPMPRSSDAPQAAPAAHSSHPPEPSIPPAARVPSEHAPAASVRPARPVHRERLEANVGATTESNFFVGFSGDIAEGGVFVATYQTLPYDTPVELLVTLPGGFDRTIMGRVRFVRDPMDMDSEPGMGIRFEALDKEARELILRFIRKRPPLFYDD